VPFFLPTILQVDGISMGVNYGCEKVRFPSPVPVGSKVRCGAAIESVDDVAGGVQATITATIEVEGAPKPSCVAQVVYRYYE
jgi:acyl dehydratase